MKGRGAPALLETFDQINRGLARSRALSRLPREQREAALAHAHVEREIIEPRAMASIAALIEDEVEAGAYDPPVDVPTLAYAIARLADAFLYNDAVAGIRGGRPPPARRGGRSARLSRAPS